MTTSGVAPGLGGKEGGPNAKRNWRIVLWLAAGALLGLASYVQVREINRDADAADAAWDRYQGEMNKVIESPK